MSNKEKVIALLDSVPEYKMGYLLAPAGQRPRV